MDYKKLCNILMDWSMRSGEYDMSYALFTQFDTAIPVKLTYALPDRRVRNLNNFDDDRKVIVSMELWKLLEIAKRCKYGQLPEGGWGYMFNSSALISS
jgi:hypothetical protein